MQLLAILSQFFVATLKFWPIWKK